MISQLLTKKHLSWMFIFCMSTFLFACNGGSSASQSAQPVSALVKSIYPSNNDTDIGIATPIVVTFNTNINESQISANLVDTSNREITSNIALKISGSGSIYTFTPERSLLTNTTYKFTLQNNVSNQTNPTSIITTFSTQPNYQIFTTSGGYKGNLRGSTSSAVTGADALCNADAGNPDKSKYYKAMLTASTERYACVANNICGGLNSQNWVLQPYTGYYNVNNQLIESANGQSIFVFPLGLPFGLSGSDNVWTGLTDNWGSSGDGDSCKAWTSSSSDNKGKCGRSGQTGVGSISNDQQDCNGTRRLYCVMQPTVVLENPIKGSTTTNLASSISVRFNMVGGVNPSTINTATFSVIESSAYQIGQAIAGTISSNGSDVFIFTPSAPLKSGKTYYVNLSSAITSNNGVAISPTTFTFFTAGETKLIFVTQDSWWGDLQEVAKKAGLDATSGITGADSLCGADPQCPAGKVCKAIISDNDTRIACILSESGVPLCGNGYTKDWVLSADTDYVNTSGVFLGTTNGVGIFNFAVGFQFTTPLSSSGKQWTGLTKGWTSDNKGTCEKWTKGDSGVNQIGGLLGYPDTVDYRSIGSNNAGGCSQYNYDDGFDKYCITDDIDGCSKRSLYCATQ